MAARGAFDDYKIPRLEIAVAGGIEGLHQPLVFPVRSPENTGVARSSTEAARDPGGGHWAEFHVRPIPYILIAFRRWFVAATVQRGRCV